MLHSAALCNIACTTLLLCNISLALLFYTVVLHSSKNKIIINYKLIHGSIAINRRFIQLVQKSLTFTWLQFKIKMQLLGPLCYT